jgi:hypothetical protein
VDNATNFAYASSGTGSTPSEQFVAVNPANVTDTTPVQPGQTAVLQSSATGLYCRVARVNSTATPAG